jgi:hypothetical protein
MKPTTLLRLYPRAWRERYGEEFLALTGAGSLRLRDTTDILRACVVEWTRTRVVGPTLVAVMASTVAEGVGRQLRGLHVRPPEAVSGLTMLLAVSAIGYLLWRTNEWLFERSPVAGRRQAQVGLALAVAAGIISTWTALPSGHGIIGEMWPIGNPAFFWAWILWSARRLSVRATT